MSRFKTAYTSKPYKGLLIDEVSKTVPNQAISVREIIRRFQQGLPLEGVISKKPVFEGEEDIPDFRKMDFTEVEEYKNHLADVYTKYQEDLKDKQKQQLDEKRKQEINAEVEKEIAKRAKNGVKGKDGEVSES